MPGPFGIQGKRQRPYADQSDEAGATRIAPCASGLNRNVESVPLLFNDNDTPSRRRMSSDAEGAIRVAPDSSD